KRDANTAKRSRSAVNTPASSKLPPPKRPNTRPSPVSYKDAVKGMRIAIVPRAFPAVRFEDKQATEVKQFIRKEIIESAVKGEQGSKVSGCWVSHGIPKIVLEKRHSVEYINAQLSKFKHQLKLIEKKELIQP